MAVDAPEEVIDGMAGLFPRHIKAHRYNVLSIRNNSITAWEVNTKELTCGCPDQQFNRQNGEICDHLAVALYEAPKRLSVEDTAPFYLSESIERAQEAAETAETIVDSLDEGLTSLRDKQAQTATEDSLDEDSPDPDPRVETEDVERFIDRKFASPDLVDIRAGSHGEHHGIILEPDTRRMDDAGSEAFKSIIKTLEGSNCHTGFLDEGCAECGANDGEYYWFVPEDDNSVVWQ